MPHLDVCLLFSFVITVSQTHAQQYFYLNPLRDSYRSMPFYRTPHVPNHYFAIGRHHPEAQLTNAIRKSPRFATDDHRGFASLPNAVVRPQHAVDMEDENGLEIPFERPGDLIAQRHLDQETENDCSAFPNGTDQSPHFFTCARGSGPVLLTLHNSALTNKSGDDRMPVDFSQPVRVFIDVTSYASKRYDNLAIDVTLYRRSTGWLGCGWMYLPTFGYISNHRMCEDNPSCPIQPGRQTVELEVDPSPLFTGFFKYFQSKQVPYQLVLRIRNRRRPEEELLCLTYQMKIRF